MWRRFGEPNGVIRSYVPETNSDILLLYKGKTLDRLG